MTTTIPAALDAKIKAQKWVQARVEIGGKLVSVIGNEWFDKVDVTLSSRPLTDYNGGWDFTAKDQAVRYLKSLQFGPYQNVGEPDFEAAVDPAAEKLAALIIRFEQHYDTSVAAGKTHFVFCEDHDEFSIIITVREG
jgi:hypothetical protein